MDYTVPGVAASGAKEYGGVADSVRFSSRQHLEMIPRIRETYALFTTMSTPANAFTAASTSPWTIPGLVKSP